jgi:hypothetical protein
MSNTFREQRRNFSTGDGPLEKNKANSNRILAWHFDAGGNFLGEFEVYWDGLGAVSGA